MLQVLGLGAAVTKEDKRYIKKLNDKPVHTKVFSVAVNAIKAMPNVGSSSLEERLSIVERALEQSGIDRLSMNIPISAIMFRLDALNHVFHQMGKQEFASLNDGAETLDNRIIAAAASEPLIPVVQDGSHLLTFDLSSFRKALMRKGGSRG